MNAQQPIDQLTIATLLVIAKQTREMGGGDNTPINAVQITTNITKPTNQDPITYNQKLHIEAPNNPFTDKVNDLFDGILNPVKPLYTDSKTYTQYPVIIPVQPLMR
jgi:hypothetical protein